MPGRRSTAAFLFVICLLLAGCSAPTGELGSSSDDSPPDPPSDRLGWEKGYWYNESIAVDQSDGLSDAETDAYVGRAMARVEQLRREEFAQDVPVSIVSREEYRNRSQGGSGNNSSAFRAWNNQVWEALFIVGERNDSQAKLGKTRGRSVVGFYSSADDEIKIITESPDRPVIRNATLIHELVHAVQDQRYNLSAPVYHHRTQDGGLATDGLIEGDAKYVEQLYVQRCANDWECVETPAQSQDDGPADAGSQTNFGILLTVLQPYSDGPVYVHNLRQRGGWDAVDAAYDSPPASTEQVIHLTNETPTPIPYKDRSRNGWSLFPAQGENGSDTVGEASMFTMLWYQARTSGADTVEPRTIRAQGPYDTYDYSAEPSAGWANDRVFPYHKGSGTDAKYGYVWVSEWDSPEDARQFRETYLRMLEAHGVRRTDSGLYVIPDGEFADAFRVTRTGTRVTVVNGPTPAAVRAIRPASGAGTGAGSES